MAVEQISRAYAAAVERGEDRLVRAAGETMEKDGLATEADTQRWSAIVMGRATAHAPTPAPGSTKAFDDLSCASLETIGSVCLGHGPTPAGMPPSAQPPVCARLNALSYELCSFYVLSRFGHKGREMRLRCATTGAMVIGLAFAPPAQAQQAANLEIGAAPAVQQDGFSVAEASNGFQLVEHGTWQRLPTVASSRAPLLKADRVRLPDHYEKSDGSGPSGFRRASYLPHVYAAEVQYALPTGLLDAVVWTESRYNPLAISRAGAAGLGQLMPATARDLGVSNRFDPMASIFGAARYLRQMLDKFGVVHLALAAYNAGPGAVEQAGGIPRNGETPAYVRDVLRRWRF